MLDFNFYNPVKIIFGKNRLSRLSKEISKNDRVLLLYGQKSIKESGVYDQIKECLKGYKLFEFSGITANPTYEFLCEAVAYAKKEKINFLLGVGGGSVIDSTKFVSAATLYEGEDPWDILGSGKKVLKAIPFGVVLTLPATGSEMNATAVITRSKTKEKFAFHSSLLYPKFSILDPTLTFTVSREQTANGVVDAFTHVLEQYLTYPINSPLQDRLAEGVLMTLLEEGPKALASPQDFDVRANIMWSCSMALNGLIGAGVPNDWSTHQIGHELTALYGLDHAKTLAILLPSTLWIMREQKRAKLLLYARRVWELNGCELSEDFKIEKVISLTRKFFEDLGVATRLSAYGIDRTEIEVILTALREHGRLKMGEQGAVTLEVSRQILENSL